MEDNTWIGILVFVVAFSTAIVALTACIRWLARRKLIGWIAALLILFAGAALYALNLFVALASDGTTWDKYIPLFRVGMDIGTLLFAIGTMGILIMALVICLRWLVKRASARG
jgi:hypothetical protein